MISIIDSQKILFGKFIRRMENKNKQKLQLSKEEAEGLKRLSEIKRLSEEFMLDYKGGKYE